MEVYSIKINSGSLAKLINNFGFPKKKKDLDCSALQVSKHPINTAN